MLLDYCPWIRGVVVDRKEGKGEGTGRVVDAQQLSPFAYVWKKDRAFEPELKLCRAVGVCHVSNLKNTVTVQHTLEALVFTPCHAGLWY